MTSEEITEILRAELKPKRFKHTLGVVDTAREMAIIFGEDEQLAARAGLLHDNAKAFDLKRMREIADQAGLMLTPEERASAALLHAPVGAYLARARFGETDERVINAIRYHTTGRPNMSALEAIVYLADMIEPNRDAFLGLEDLRVMARRDLFAALEMGLGMSNSYVLKRGQTLFERSKKAYDWVRQYNKGRNDYAGRNASAV